MKLLKTNSICVFAKPCLAVILLAFIFFTTPSVSAQYVGSSLTIGSFILSGTVGLIRPPKTLTDPNATDEAKSLMSFLVDYYGEKVLSGQQSLSDINYIESVTGKVPAIGVFDLMDYSPSRIEHGADPTGDVESYISWADSGGGIVSLSWHWNAPTDLIDEPGAEWWRGFYTFATTFDIAAVLADPGGAKYQLLIRDLDAIAAELQKFEDANLPVLWRPLHEASGGWFWWGAQGSGPFIELWQLMYDRYVNYHGLGNLIWVYTVGDASWYPGDSYVDIASMDIYPSNPESSMVWEWQDTQSRHEGVKLVALSESGILPDPDKIRADDVWWSWFSVWNGSFIRDVDQAFLTSVYNDEDIITLDELIDWKNHPVDSSPPTCSINWPLNSIKIRENSNMAIRANASDTDGTISKVEFFEGVNKLGQDTTSPFEYPWTNIPAGIYVLTAKATDSNDLITTSSEVTLVVGSTSMPEPVRYEAEDAASDRPSIRTNYPGYSGTGSRFFDGASGTGVDFTVTSSEAGSFPLTIRYLIPSGWGTKDNSVHVNSVLLGTPTFANTNSTWTDFDFGLVSLNSGSNTVRIQHNWGYMYVDYIELELPGSSACPDGDFNLDCGVDADDLNTLAAFWLNPYDINDFAAIAQDWSGQ